MQVLQTTSIAMPFLIGPCRFSICRIKFAEARIGRDIYVRNMFLLRYEMEGPLRPLALAHRTERPHNDLVRAQAGALPPSMLLAKAREPSSTRGCTVRVRSSGKKSLIQTKRQLVSSTGRISIDAE